ncbi:hypothetical protein RDI58_018123 [Solanum bulbocastanum]|uniref:Uncharacterized protein n=1 Tax=Solanum bulbocastanum TaxID=147425 RepID=A0AAN8TA30_SOLBU
MEIVDKVHYGFILLQKIMEQLIREINPNCIVSDVFFPWTVDLAKELQNSRFSFQPATFIYQCAWVFIREFIPYKNVASDSERFLIPDLPLDIKMKISEIEDFLKEETEYKKTVDDILQAEVRSHSIIHNTCSDLEPGFAQLYEKARGVKRWHIGPLALFINKYEAEISSKQISNLNNSCSDPWKGYSDCFNCLEDKQPNFVLFVCFGSMIRFFDDQLKKMAVGLKASNCPTIWVFREQYKNEVDEKDRCDWSRNDNFYTDKLLETLGLAIEIGADVWNLGLYYRLHPFQERR